MAESNALPLPPGQRARTARPRRVAKVMRRSRHERTGDRAPIDLGDRINKNTLVVIAGGLASTDLAVTHEMSTVLDDGATYIVRAIHAQGVDTELAELGADGRPQRPVEGNYENDWHPGTRV